MDSIIMKDILAVRTHNNITVVERVGRAAQIKTAFRKAESYLAAGCEILLLLPEEAEELISDVRLANEIITISRAAVLSSHPEMAWVLA